MDKSQDPWQGPSCSVEGVEDQNIKWINMNVKGQKVLLNSQTGLIYNSHPPSSSEPVTHGG